MFTTPALQHIVRSANHALAWYGNGASPHSAIRALNSALSRHPDTMWVPDSDAAQTALLEAAQAGTARFEQALMHIRPL